MSDNLGSLFQRRQRHIGKPLRPSPEPVAAPAAAELGKAMPATPLPEKSASPVPYRRRRPSIPSTHELAGVERASIFLASEQARWLKGLRGRFLVRGEEISASEVVRLALERLQEAELTDDDLRSALMNQRLTTRSRGRPPTKSGPARPGSTRGA